MKDSATAPGDTCVQFIFFKVDRSWRRLPAETRAGHKEEFLNTLREAEAGVATHSFSTLGLRADTDFMLWRTASAIEDLEDTLSDLLATELGAFLEVSHAYFGLLRRSTYGQARTKQDHAEQSPDRGRYFVLYPFTKTIAWYLLAREARQGMMNEHIRVGRTFPNIGQLLLYSTGLGDQEFIVGYETDSLAEFQDLVIELRSTEARRYTCRTPRSSPVSIAAPSVSWTCSVSRPPRRALTMDRGSEPALVQAARMKQTERTPVWFMRQAGRVLPEYRKVRSSYGLLEICRQPELAATVTLQPVARFDVDAAVIFADIVTPLVGVGVDLKIVEQVGPVIAAPVRSRSDLERFRQLEPDQDLPYLLEALRLVRAELPQEKALIGFSRCPLHACHLSDRRRPVPELRHDQVADV